MKKIYEKPVLSKRGKLAGVTAVTAIGSGTSGQS
jgi:glycine/D-amino acid oxidase-like deaminating enzyme